MNISESRSVTEICRMLNNSPFPEEAVAHLEFLLDRARMALGACVPDPTPVPMEKQWCVEVKDHHGQWQRVRSKGEDGWFSDREKANRLKADWAEFTRPRRIASRWVTESEVRDEDQE